MNKFDNVELDEVDEYEDYQYEASAEMSDEFLEEHVAPLMNAFENHNPSEDYIPGTATLGLFIKLVGSLTKFGYTPEQLIEIVVEGEVPSDFDTLH